MYPLRAFFESSRPITITITVLYWARGDWCISCLRDSNHAAHQEKHQPWLSTVEITNSFHCFFSLSCSTLSTSNGDPYPVSAFTPASAALTFKISCMHQHNSASSLQTQKKKRKKRAPESNRSHCNSRLFCKGCTKSRLLWGQSRTPTK